MPDAAEKDKARGRIKAAAKKHDIDLSDDSLAMAPSGRFASAKDPDEDSDDDTAILSAIATAQRSCEDCAEYLETAAEEYDDASLTEAVTESKKTVVALAAAVEAMDEELAEGDEDDEDTKQARARGRKLLASLTAAVEPFAVYGAAAGNGKSTGGAVAVLPIQGLITHRGGDWFWSCGTTVESFTRQFRSALNDPSISAIVLDIDSPGGTVDGVPELADEIYRARGKKPVVAVANCMAASAAYWLGCSASELVVTPSGQVGSVGVFGVHTDISKALDAAGVAITLISSSKYKTENNSYTPITDEGRAAIQDQVDYADGMFTRAVARGRDAKADEVRSGFGQGRMVMAQDAVKAGMADRVDTLDGVLAKFGVARANGPLRGSAAGVAAASRVAGTEPPNPPDDPGDTTRKNKKSKKKASDASLCECECGPCAEDDHENCDVDVCPTPEACGHEPGDNAEAAKKREQEAQARRIALEAEA